MYQSEKCLIFGLFPTNSCNEISPEPRISYKELLEYLFFNILFKHFFGVSGHDMDIDMMKTSSISRKRHISAYFGNAWQIFRPKSIEKHQIAQKSYQFQLYKPLLISRDVSG